MRSISTRGIAALLIAIATAGLFMPTTTSAHERRTIADGKADVIVGWLTEPAYVQQPNGIEFRVTDPLTNQPIEGLEKTVKVEVIHGGSTRQFDLRARFGQPGAYTADIIPMRTGDYTFRFTGEINGAVIDERFESGPGRFDGIKPLADMQFPVQAPTTSELSSQLVDAQAAADLARTIALAAGVIAAASLLLTGVVLVRGRTGAAARPIGRPSDQVG